MKFFEQFTDVSELNIYRIEIVNKDTKKGGAILVPAVSPEVAIGVVQRACNTNETIPIDGEIGMITRIRNRFLFAIETFGFCKVYD